MKTKSRGNKLGGMVVGAGVCVALCAACGNFPYDTNSESGGWPNKPGGSGDPNPGPVEPDDPDDGSDIGYNPVKPNVMLLVDRSGSMAEPADCGETRCPSKWEQLLSLSVYLAEAKQVANLGLAVFPSPEHNGCSVSQSVLVPLSDAPDVDEQMMAAIEQVMPGGKTPVAAALDELRLTGGFDDRDRDHTVVVLTDGRPNCSCEDDDTACERDEAVRAVERLENSDPSVDIDIIGFGTSAQAAHETLTAMAQAAGDDRYYQSDTIEDLISTLYEIAVEKVPCTFHLDEWPEPDRLIVWFDDVQVPPCEAEPCDSGYTYDQSVGIVDFHGTTCDALRDGQQHYVWFDELQ